MKGLTFYGVRDLRYEEVPYPEIKNSTDAVVKVKAAGICGSDLARYRKLGPYVKGTVWGHEFSGDVVEIGSDVKNVKVGDRVVGAPVLPCFKCKECMCGRPYECDHSSVIGQYTGGCFAEYIRIPSINLVKMPDAMTYEEGALAEPSTVTLHALYVSDITMGDEIAVVGCGTIGLLAMQWARLFGAKTVYALDINDKKLVAAKEAGADVVINSKGKDVYEEIRKYTSEGVDIAFESSGNPIGVAQTLGLPKKSGEVIYIGVPYADVSIPRFYYERIVRCHLTVKGSFNNISAPFPGKEWTNAVKYFAEKAINIDPVITHRVPLKDGPEIFEKIMENKDDYGKVILYPEEK